MCSTDKTVTLKKNDLSENKPGLMKKQGPGIWFAFHTMSLSAVTRDLSRFLIIFIKKTVRSFECPICRGHAISYLRKNPPELSVENLFAWTVDFHNDVNFRNNKKIWGYYEAYKHYGM